MRKMLLIGATALLLPTAALAQTDPSLSEGVPTPREELSIDGFRLAAISIGAVAGVIAANVITGGMLTPVLLVGGTEAGMTGMAGGAAAAIAPAAEAAVVTGASYTMAATQAVVTVAGGVIGGYVGNWLYGY